MESYNEIITKNPIIIDNGSGEMKAGLGGDDHPSLVFASHIGRPKYKEVVPTSIETEQYLGSAIDKKKGLLKLRYPISHGVITNFSDMELIWKHIYSELKVTSKEHPVLLTEAAINPSFNRVEMAKIFFETFNAPAIFVAVQAVLSLYAHGETTGVVLDSGDGVTHCVPIFEGFSIQHAATRIDLGGRDITENLALLLRKTGHNFHTSAEFEIVKKIKEKCCTISEVAKDDKLVEKDNKMLTQYILPDGTTIDIGVEKFRAPEILFAPEKIGLEYPPIHELLVNTVKKCDMDLRKRLYSEILLAGGNTMIHGFPERFLNELNKVLPKELKKKVYAPPERKTSCWVGGSILSTLATFKKMWITKKEFDEQGERVLFMKSF